MLPAAAKVRAPFGQWLRSSCPLSRFGVCGARVRQCIMEIRVPAIQLGAAHPAVLYAVVCGIIVPTHEALDALTERSPRHIRPPCSPH
jgi:hypothetical protein